MDSILKELLLREIKRVDDEIEESVITFPTSLLPEDPESLIRFINISKSSAEVDRHWKIKTQFTDEVTKLVNKVIAEYKKKETMDG